MLAIIVFKGLSNLELDSTKKLLNNFFSRNAGLKIIFKDKIKNIIVKSVDSLKKIFSFPRTKITNKGKKKPMQMY